MSKDKKLEKYYEHREKLKSADCLLWKTDVSINPNTWIGGLIQFWSKFNHASFIFNEFNELSTSKYVLEALGSGIVLKKISKRLEKFHGEVYWLQLKDEYSYLRPYATQWALSQVGKPYDYGSIVKNIFGRVNNDASFLFCSEFCYISLKMSYLKNLTEKGISHPALTKTFSSKKAPRPGDLAKMPIWDSVIQIL